MIVWIAWGLLGDVLCVSVCSDGVGRTGTFICIHSQLERLKTEGIVDLFQSVKSARVQRAGLVPEPVSPATGLRDLMS